MGIEYQITMQDAESSRTKVISEWLKHLLLTFFTSLICTAPTELIKFTILRDLEQASSFNSGALKSSAKINLSLIKQIT